ncbi:ATP-binding protein [Thermodesulfobacteriota bacterium]
MDHQYHCGHRDSIQKVNDNPQAAISPGSGLRDECLFEEVPCYLTVVNPEFRIVRANRAFRDQFGDQTNKSCFTGYKGLDKRCRLCPVERTFADGGSHQSEEIWKVDGADAHVIVKTAPILDSAGKVAEVLEMAVDVTMLKQLQLELEKREDDYKQLFNNVPCYLTVVDKDYNVIQANDAFETDFGSRIGDKCYKVYKKQDVKCDDCPVKQTFMDGKTHTSEHRWFLKGQERHIVATTNPIRDASGEITAVMEMCTNVTEAKRLQSELALLGESIAGMSHSIKNILAGLQGGVYVIDSGLKRGKEDRVREGWDMVKRNVGKVSDLVKGILYASKERVPDKIPCDPGKLLTEICDLFEHATRAEDIRIIRDFENELGRFDLDPAGIHSAVSNLVSNAIEACRSKGPGTHSVTVAGKVEDNVLHIRVTDDGIGMSEEVRERLFSKFYSTKGSKGTGLGLVITRKVVQEHGGVIDVESQPGEGTTFHARIPVKSADAKEAPLSILRSS